ncbi:MAG: hypothetical protein RI560_09030, partial [Natronomonas sp.]|nr:hypothetical protein [Natronomonas sp.]
MPHEDDNEDQPSNAIDSYLRVHLDTDELDSTRVEDALTRLHRCRTDAPLEIRLVADDTIRYYIGTADTRGFETEDILRTLFPDGTNITDEAPPALPDES